MTLGGARANVRQKMGRNSEKPPATKRKPITRAALELAIAESVRDSSPDCRGLIGVIVERVVPKSPADANWVLKGVRYGKAQRERCNAAISVCVADGQHEFEVSD